MSFEEEVTPEEAEQIVEEIAQIIHRHQMYTPAVIFLESTKPLTHLGGEFIHNFVVPFIPVFSEEWGRKSPKYVTTLQSKENVEKLIQRIEALLDERNAKKPTGASRDQKK